MAKNSKPKESLESIRKVFMKEKGINATTVKKILAIFSASKNTSVTSTRAPVPKFPVKGMKKPLEILF